MFPIISYTFHASVCLCLGLIFLFYKGEEGSRGSAYRFFLRILSAIALISAAMSGSLLYLYAKGIDESFIYGFVSPFFNIFLTGLYLRPCQINLRSNAKLLQWQDGLTWAFVSLGFVHPVLYYQYQISHHSAFSPSLSSYQEFLQTPGCRALTMIVYIVGAMYLALSLYNTVRHLRIVLLWDKQHQGQRVFALAFKIFFFLFFALLLMIADTVLFMYFDFPYYADLPVWTAFSLVAVIEVLNCKQDYFRLEHEAIRLQIEFAGARMFYNKSALKLREDENNHHREQAVVLRAISDWSARADRPYLNENLTISSLSEEIGIPEIIIIRYLNSAYGLTFEEYIGYLTSDCVASDARS